MQSLVKSIERALEVTLRSPSCCHVLSWEAGFERLWQLDETARGDLVAPDHTLVLVWDREPSGRPSPVRLSDYISPFDWALAVALWNSRRRPSEKLGRVVIVERGNEAMGEAARFLRGIQFSNSPLLPWLAVATMRTGKELVTVLRAIGNLCSSARPQEVSPAALTCLRDMWVGTLTRPESTADHHAVANLLGSRLLLGRVSGKDRDDPRLTALQRLLQLLGVHPDPQLGTHGHRDEPFPWVPKSEWSPAVTEFVLVDDLHAEGWSEFLEQALDARGHLVVQDAADRPDAGSLLDLLEDDDELKSVRGLPGQEWDRRVLFLDLRLFSGRPVGHEAEFFNRLLEVAKGRRTLGFDRTDLEAVERCVATGARETEDYYAAITLLPRLLAEADPFLPIIVFSSTRQRSVIDRLLRYDNILLDFDKPRLGGHGFDAQRTDSRVRFQRVVGRALQIVEARALCRTSIRPPGRPNAEEDEESPITTAGDESASSMACPTDTPQGEPVTATTSATPLSTFSPEVAGQHRALDIFIDESHVPRTRRFTVGGLAILYKDESGPATLDGFLHRDSMAWGVGEGWPPTYPDDPLPEAIPKLDSSARHLEQLEKLEKIVIEAGGLLFAFGLVTTSGPDEQTIDGLYHAMLREVLESLVFLVFPAYGCETVPLAIDVATRNYPIRPSRPDGPQLTEAELSRNFGLRFLSDGRFYSLAGDHVHGFVRDVFDTRSKRAGLSELRRARGVTLRDYQDVGSSKEAWLDLGKPSRYDLKRWQKEWRDIGEKNRADQCGDALHYLAYFRDGVWNAALPLQAHFASDCVVRLVSRNDTDFRGSLDQGLLKKLFDRGFLEERSAARLWLDASRMGYAGRPAEALARVWEGKLKPREPYSLGRWIDCEAEHWVRGLDANGFRELMGRLDVECQPRRVQAAAVSTPRSSRQGGPSVRATKPLAVRGGKPVPPAAELARTIFEMVTGLVLDSAQPVAMAKVAQKVHDHFGPCVKNTAWAGAGNFKALLQSNAGYGVEISAVPGRPGYLWNPVKHSVPIAQIGEDPVPSDLASREDSSGQIDSERSVPVAQSDEGRHPSAPAGPDESPGQVDGEQPAPVDLKSGDRLQLVAADPDDLLLRIIQVTGAPNLSSSQYATIFQEISKVIAIQPYHPTKTANAVQHACIRRRETIARLSISFILRAIIPPGSTLGTEPIRVAASALAERFKERMATLCRGTELEGADLREFLDRWITGDMP
jgi:hypothetical protein